MSRREWIGLKRSNQVNHRGEIRKGLRSGYLAEPVLMRETLDGKALGVMKASSSAAGGRGDRRDGRPAWKDRPQGDRPAWKDRPQGDRPAWKDRSQQGGTDRPDRRQPASGGRQQTRPAGGNNKGGHVFRPPMPTNVKKATFVSIDQPIGTRVTFDD